MSDLGLLAMGGIIAYWISISDLATVTKMYTIPYLLANHWIVMLTYLHHTDPTMPHFRKDTWTFVRGAITTVDRPLLGWVGRFFLHNVSHDHVAHHLISSIPHCKSLIINLAWRSINNSP
jgi:fatty acid desaturase